MAGKSKLYSIVLFTFLFLPISAAASSAQIQNSPSVKASVDKIKISQDDTLTFKIEISGDLKANPEINLPDLKKDFDIFSTAQSQSLSIKGKELSRQVTFIYVLAAKATGRFTIGEASVKIGKQTFKTQSINIEVTPSLKPKPKEPPSPSPAEPGGESESAEQVIL